MVDSLFGKLAYLKFLILANYWPSIEKIEKVKCPIFFILSLNDEIVPP